MKALLFSAMVLGNPVVASAALAQVSILQHGAIANVNTDAAAATNNDAIRRAIAAAQSAGTSVFVPEGTFAYSDLITLDSIKMQGTGATSVLFARNYAREAVFMYGDGPAISNIKLSGVRSPTRFPNWEMTRVTVFGATNFVIDGVIIDGSAAAGIQTGPDRNGAGASNGRIINNTIKDTLADSIHMTDKANNITVENNRIENSGDDGIAVVSYMATGDYVHHITARNNIVLNNKWGRQMSVVGGRNVLYENNYLEGNPLWACLYLAQESSYATFAAHDVVARYNTLKNCGSPSTHAAVMIFSDGQETNTNISLLRNDLIQSGQGGIRVFSNFNTGVALDSNRIQGANPDYDIRSASVRLTRYVSGAVGYVAPGTGPITVSTVSPVTIGSQPGRTFNLTYRFSGGATARADNVFVHFVNSNGDIAMQDDHAPPTPTTAWRGDVTYGRAITAPPTLPYGTYQILAGLYDRATGSRLPLTAGVGVFAQPDARYKVGTLVMQPLRPVTVLRSTPAAVAARPGQSFTLTYSWFGGATERPLTVLVHFVNASGAIAFQDDHDPDAPTTTWNGNHSTSRTIGVPATLPTGTYKIMVGLYDPIAGTRSSLTAGPGVVADTEMRYLAGTLRVQTP